MRRLLPWSLALFLAPAPLPASERPPMMPAADHAAWQAIGRVNVTGYRRRSACSGALVAPEIVLTAAHCVFRGARPARVPDIRFAAGWLRGEAAALGRVAEVRLPRDWSPALPATVGAAHRDVALLILERPLDRIRPLAVTREAGGGMRIIGYRWDRPHALTDHAPCGGLARFAPALGLTCPVVAGTSGAPVLTFEDGGWRVMGVTSAQSGGVTVAAPVSEADIARWRHAPSAP